MFLLVFLLIDVVGIGGDVNDNVIVVLVNVDRMFLLLVLIILVGSTLVFCDCHCCSGTLFASVLFFCFDLLHLLIVLLFLLCDVGMLGVVLASVVASVCFLCAHLL